MRRLLTMLAAFAVVLLAVIPAYAADSRVTYNGNAGQFIFEMGSEQSPTDLFADFKGVMPGDALTQKITVKNEADDKVKVKIYLRSLGAQEGSAEFLSQLGLKVQKSEDNEMAYMFDATADQTAGLTDWVCLGTLYSGGEVNLDVILNVPAEMDNEFQNKIGYLDWEFKVEELPVEPDDPKPPQTGENSRIGIWLAVMLCSLSAMLIILIYRKRNKENIPAQD